MSSPRQQQASHSSVGSTVERWGRFDQAFRAEAPVADPTHDVELLVTFSDPSGADHTVRGFWDGENVWRVRFSPDQEGEWAYRTESEPEVAGLHDRRGTITCVKPTGNNRIARHGAIGISEDGHYLAHADGTPFFCLGDTVWSGPMRATIPDWDVYLRDRTEKRFTSALIAVDKFQGGVTSIEGESPYYGQERIRINPAFYQRVDPLIDAINDSGMLAIVLFLHAGNRPQNSAHILPEHEAITLGRYIVARYGAHQVMWDILAETQTGSPRVESWKRIARAVLDRNPGKPVTMHPPGAPAWALDEYADESWMTVLGYQSSHGESDRYWEFIIHGAPSTDWKRTPHRPIMNLEPPYEDHRSFTTGKRFDARTVRLGCWSSLLATAVSGVTYGGQGVWGWDDGKHFTFGHRNTGLAKPWWDALQLPGATSMRHLAECMNDIAWWTLRPAQDAIAEQPGDEDIRRSIIAAASPDGGLLVAYLPDAVRLVLNIACVRSDGAAQWFNPRTGVRTPAELEAQSQTLVATPPGDQDWVFVLRPPS